MFFGWLTVGFGAALTLIDFRADTPLSWRWGEGPLTIPLGGVIVWLARNARQG